MGAHSRKLFFRSFYQAFKLNENDETGDWKRKSMFEKEWGDGDKKGGKNHRTNLVMYR